MLSAIKSKSWVSIMVMRAFQLGIMFAPLLLHAVPASPDVFETAQPDGKKIKIHLRGDEYFSWHEDERGYAVAKDPKDKTWKYAKPKNGSVAYDVIPNAVVGKIQPARLNLKKGDVPHTAVLREHIRKQREILPDEPSANGAAGPDAVDPAPASVEPPPPQPIPISGTKTIKNIVILASFSDHWDGVNATVLATKGRTNATEYDNLFNQTGHTTDSAVGSVKDYYKEVSYGKLTVQSVVTPWVVLPQTQAFYGANNASGNDTNPRQMVVDAIAAAQAAGFDFSQGDGDGDGWVDCLTIIHSGLGEELVGNPTDSIWSHQWTMSSVVTANSVKMKTYHTSPALRGGTTSTAIIRIGVICHEMGHFFGLPDLYDYAGAYSNTSVGRWCVMSGGSWGGGDGKMPSHFSAWCKQALGFAMPQLTHSVTSLSVPDVKASDTIHMIRDGCSNGEYFLVENRNQTGFDASTPGRGIMIWHIDPKSGNNDSGTWPHPLVKMEDADGDTNANEAVSAWYSGNAGMLAGGFRDQTGNSNTNAMRYQAGYFTRTNTAADYTYVRLNNFSTRAANMTAGVLTLVPTVTSQSVNTADYTVNWAASSDATQYEIQEGQQTTATTFTEGFENEDAVHENWSLAGAATTTAGKRSGTTSMLFSMYHDAKWWSSVQSLFSRNAYQYTASTAIQFHYMSRLAAGNGRFQFLASNDNGQTWVALWSHSGGTVSAWTAVNITAANLSTAGFTVGDNLRFSYTMNCEHLSGSNTFPSYGWAIDDFSITNTAYTSHANWTTLHSAVATPSYGITGKDNGTYAYRVRGYTNNTWQSYSPAATVTVSGIVYQPEIAVEQPVGTNLADGAATINFGSVTTGSSSSAFTVTIRNTGNADLTGLALSKTGTHSADYTLGSLGATTLAPGASTTFGITFTPGATGPRTAALQIASNDSDENPFDIALTGTGLPLGTLSVTAGNFSASGNYGGSITPSSQVYTLENTGSTTLDWTAAKTAAWVTLSPTSGTLAAGASTTVTATLNADALNVGSYADIMTFTNTTNGLGTTTRNVDLTVHPIPVAITISNLLQFFDGSAKPVTITTNPTGKAFTVTYNGSPAEPTNAGSYNVVVTITEPNHAGTDSATHVIAYQVAYHGNGNTTGSTPASQAKFLDTPLTLTGNTGNLLKTNATFVGWNTADDGTGTDYPDGSTYSGNANITLYAKWLSGGNGTWLPTTAGPFNWSDTTNWSGDIVASGTDNTAFFTPNITAAQTATLDTARTIGNITFTDSGTSSHNLTIAGTNPLTLSRTSGMPVVDVTQSARQLTISTPITGIHGLQKDGPGILDLRNISNNFSGGIVLNAGTLAASTNAGSNHFGNNPITVNGAATISAANTNVNPTTTGITINNASLLTLDASGAQITVNGDVTGTGAGISIGSTANTGAKTINLNGTNNSFTGPIEYWTATNAGNAATLNLVSLADTSTLGQGNIRFGVSGATGNTVNTHTLSLAGTATQALELTNRRIELAGTTNSIPTISNNSTQPLTINSDLHFSGGGSKLFTLSGSTSGLSTFAGEIDDSTTPTTGTTALAAGYATGATVIRLASIEGIVVGNTISGPNIPAGTTITTVNTATSEVTLSAATTNSGAFGAAVTTTGVVGNLGIVKQGTGTWALTDPNNAFSGPIILNTTNASAGTLRFASAGGSNLILCNQTTSNATLSYTGAGQTMSGLLHAPALTSGTITLDASGAGPIHYSNPDSLKSVVTSNTIRKLVLSGDNTGNNIFAGALTNNIGTTNAATLTKSGPGTWILTGENAHTGTTTVSAGKLFIHGNQTNATGNLSVSANATLGGTGIIGGNTTIAASGRLEFDLSTRDTSHDTLELATAKTLTFSGASTLTLTTSGGAAPGQYILCTAPGGITGSAPATVNLPIGWSATVAIVGNDLVLNVTTVPVGPLASFAIHGIPAQVPVGSPVNGITLTAQDAGNQTVTSFNGTVTYSGSAGITGTSANFTNGVLTGVSITPAAAGAGRTFIVTDTTGKTGTATFDVLTVYQTWIASYGLTGGNALPATDPDADGVPNLQEFAFGTDPHAQGFGRIQIDQDGKVVSPGLPNIVNFANPAEAPDFRAVFPRRKEYLLAGLIYTVEFSADLTRWTASADGLQVLSDQSAGDVDAVSVPFPPSVPVTDDGPVQTPAFFRIRVSFAP